MKRLISLVLVVALLMTSGVVAVFAADKETDLEETFQNVIPDGEGAAAVVDDEYVGEAATNITYSLDAATGNTTASFTGLKNNYEDTNVDMLQTIQGKGIPFRSANQYASFDLEAKNLQAGLYKIEVNYMLRNGANAEFNVQVDGVDALETAFIFAPTTDTNTFVLSTTPATGYITIAENAPQQLKLIYKSSLALEVVDITLTRFGDVGTLPPREYKTEASFTDLTSHKDTNVDMKWTITYAGIPFRSANQYANFNLVDKELAAGFYKIEANYKLRNGASAEFNVQIDGVDALKDTFVFAPTTETNTFVLSTTPAKGYITINENAPKQLKLIYKNNLALELVDITLTKIEPLAVVSYDGNVGNTANVFPRGTDRFVFDLNYKINKAVLTDANFVLKGEGDEIIPTAVSVDSKDESKLIVDLKKTLDYEKSYTLSLIDVEDEHTQTLTQDIPISTGTKLADNGNTSIRIANWTTKGNLFTAGGTVLSSGGVGIAGRTLALKGKLPGDPDYALWTTDVKSNENGEFTITHTFKDTDASGDYDVVLDDEYAGGESTGKAYYFDAVRSAEIAADFSNLTDTTAVKAVFDTYSVTLGIDVTAMENNGTFDNIAAGMVNKTFDTVTDVLEYVDKLKILEKFNNKTILGDVVNIIDDESELRIIGAIQRDKWNALRDDEKLIVATNIKADGRVEKPEKLIEKIDEEINKYLQARYNLSNSDVNITTKSISVGEEAELVISATAGQENVVAIRLEIAYSENEEKLFTSNAQIVLSKDLEGLVIEKTELTGKTVYDIKVAQEGKTISRTSFRGPIATLTYMAADDTEGTYAPKVSGYIAYHTDENEDNQTSAYFVNIPFTLTSEPTFTVSAKQIGGSSDYEGGNGRPGGDPYGTTGQKPSENNPTLEIPPVTDEGTEVGTNFTDLDTVPWAKESIDALSYKGIVAGRGDGTFAPNDNVTRAEFCKMIAMTFGIVKKDATCDFADVNSSDWYYVYIASAKAAGFINGKNEKNFAPNETITREEMAAISLRALAKEPVATYDEFSDDARISEYAKAAVYTLKEYGILNGMGDNMFAPKQNVTRAMAAKVICGLLTA